MGTFTRTIDLFLGATRGPVPVIFTSRTDLSPIPTPQWIVRDKFTVRVHLLDWPATTGAECADFQLTSGDSLVISGKPEDTPGAATFLFQTIGFTEVVFSSTKYRYEALVDLNTADLIAALAAEASNQLRLRCTIQERNTGNSERLSLSFPIIVRASGISGSEGVPTSGTPAYPAPSELIRAMPAVIGLTGGGGSKLDGQTTAATLSAGVIYFIDSPGDPAAWRLRQLAITTSSAANPTTITTAKPHGFAAGQSVTIGGHTLAGVNGVLTVATVPTATTFTAAVLGGGTGGYVTPATDGAGGVVRPVDWAATTGLFWSSLF